MTPGKTLQIAQALALAQDPMYRHQQEDQAGMRRFLLTDQLEPRLRG